MKQGINLATRVYLDEAAVRRVAAVAAVILGAVLLWGVSTIAGNLGEERRLGREIRILDEKLRSKGVAVSPTELKALRAEADSANAILFRKSANWVGFLDALEEVVPDGVVVTSISPSAKEVALNGVSLDFLRIRKLLENMEASGRFPETVLLSQSEVKAPNGKSGLSFSIRTRFDFGRP